MRKSTAQYLPGDVRQLSCTGWIRAAHNVAFLAVTSDHLRLFLDQRQDDDRGKKKLNSTIRVRYLRLLERVFAHLDMDPNPARHAAFDVYKQAAGGNDVAKVILSAGTAGVLRRVAGAGCGQSV